MSLQIITELLDKQKLVERMLRNQTMHHQELVESVTHKQHLTELRGVLGRLSPGDIAEILDALTLEDARLLWAQVSPAVEEDILWNLPESVRGPLVGERQPQFSQGLINAYELVDGRIRVTQLGGYQDLVAAKPIWLDLFAISDSERRAIGRHYRLNLPNPDELTDIEVSARFYIAENDEIHLHSNFLLNRGATPHSIPVAFIINTDILFTLRNEELPVFRLQRLRARNQAGSVTDCKDVLLDLYDADVEYSADAMEDGYITLRQAGQKVLSETMTDAEATRILADIASEEDLNGLIQGNMLNAQRAMSFLIRNRLLSKRQLVAANQILRDIESINKHTAFLLEKINFLMDATVGFINVNQNRHISQLTIINIVFMPLNLLAGMGGMSEYTMMTEAVPWPLAYSLLVVGMLLTGWLTFVVLQHFEKKRKPTKPG
ncbi:MAG: magnesium transporter CorA [Gammaproteobacteria bacterium HGW-Gammaproteobacteria-3]|nr:MAG: magnesium transporter CorA [Gammaproteobacteria bacterium HGW-Gammaproteobacteria-3]